MATSALGGPGGDGLEAVELAIRTAMTRLGGSLLEQLLAADTGHRGPRVDCGAGHAAQFVGYRDKTVDTVLGPVAVRRAYYHCARCRRGVVPKDDELGTAGNSLSPGLRKMTARAAAVEPFAAARNLLAELAGIELTTKRVERSAEHDGATAATMVQAETAAILSRRVVPLPPPPPTPDMLYITVDGTGVPMVPAETAGRAGKADDGRARTREVKLACVFTQTTTDDHGRPLRDEDSSSYVASFAPAAEFGTLMAAEARRRGANHIRQLIVLGDGAPWIWNLAAKYYPEATQIVDLYHARQHLHTLAECVKFIHEHTHREWLAAQLADLDAGRIEAITAAARDLPFVGVKADERDKALHYFDTNAVRMRYARFRDLGMFVGSGAVEAGCKAVVGQRLKLSGMRWTIPGATSILTLRCHQASDRWEHIWQRPHNQIPAA